MNRLILASGTASVILGLAAVFAIAPLAVAPSFADAYTRLASSPNLVGAVAYGIVWVAMVVAATAVTARLTPPARVRTTAALALLSTGVYWVSLILTTATMSNAIIDTRPTGWPTAELPASLVSWLGAGMVVVGIVVLLTSRHALSSRPDKRGTTARA